MNLTVHEAIDTMRELTKAGRTFSFSFLSYSETMADSHGIIEVNKAKLGKSDKVEHNRNADIMLNFINVNTGEQKRFYQPLLIDFNGQQVELT